MKANIIAFGTALLIAVAAGAQSHMPSAVATDSGIHHCIAATDAATWTSLGVKPDQMTRLTAIQDACKKECAMAEKDKSTMDHATMDKHEEQVKAVLTSEQYTNWRKWCATRTSTKAEMEKSSKPEQRK